MTFVVTESCIKCRYTDCVDVCPVDCFREGPNFLTIDPDECIDCAVCVPECPVNAIFAEEDVPADQQQFIKLNAELALNWPAITRTHKPLPDAEDWKDVQDKLQYLQPSGGHMPVRRYVHPDTFKMYAEEARKIGFLHAASGPLVRSSYHADEQARAAGVF